VTVRHPDGPKVWGVDAIHAHILYPKRVVILRSIRENTTAKSSFTRLYQQQLIGTPVAVITSEID
jgi:hypothetical protein